jgi:hypothetical protein
MELKSYKTDEAMKKEGVWVPWDGSEFLIRSTDSAGYRRAVSAAAKKRNPAKVRKDIETQTELGIEAVALGILLDWRGVTDGGEPVECTKEAKLAVLKQVPDLRDFLTTEASDMANFQAEGVVADAESFHEGDQVGS